MSTASLLPVIIFAAASPGSQAATPPPAPTALYVDAREWALTLSRDRLPAGPVSLQLRNAGQDDHDLRLRRLDRRRRPTGPTHRIAVTRPGAMSHAVVALSAGRWRLWCTLDGHAAAGMAATLRARPSDAR